METTKLSGILIQNPEKFFNANKQECYRLTMCINKDIIIVIFKAFFPLIDVLKIYDVINIQGQWDIYKKFFFAIALSSPISKVNSKWNQLEKKIEAKAIKNK